MRHSSSTHFSGIPIDTNTLAGQWMTFSHMANHYRKLLNVKPRVDTGQPTNNHHHHGSFHNFSSLNNNSSTKMQFSKSKSMSSGSTKPSSAKTSSTNGGKSVCYQTIRRDNIMYGSHPEHLNHVAGKPSPQFLMAKESIGKAKAAIENSKCIDKSRHNKTKNQQQQQHHHQNQVQLNYPDYQVVFGPSSIRSSTDAFMSEETDSSVSGDKPLSEVQAPLGVSEKIRHFLNNIHQLDLKPSSLSKKKKCKRVTTDPTTNKSKSLSEGNTRAGIASPTPNSFPPSVASSATNNQIDFRLSRHSRCFLPYEPNNNLAQPPPKSPKNCKSQKSGGVSNNAAVTPTKSRKNKSLHEPTTPTSAEKHLSSPLLSLNRKQGKSKISAESEELPSKASRLSRNKFTGSGMDIHIPEKDTSSSVKRQGKIRKRAGSIASIGTICGSEELAPEDFPLSIRDIYRDIPDDDILLSKILDDHLRLQSKVKISSHHNHHRHHNNHSSGVSSVSTTNLLKSNSMASLIPEAGRSSGSKPSAAGTVNNNKDSSRDSAYGFSSGESRITTRESTPEKKCLNELEEDLHERPSKDVKESRHRIRHKSSLDEIQSKKKDTSDKYINFLAELTQDIVSKGIYTNKGLKTLFKAQLDQNRDLDKNKLSDMLERLRTDLGIPKDDALDKIEFGYGSISNATSTTFFYTPPSTHDKLSTDSVILNANNTTASSSIAGDVHLEEFTAQSSASASPSPTTIIPCIPNVHAPASHHTATTATTTTTGFSSGGPNTSSNRSTTTTDEGSGDLISVPGSDDNQALNIHDDDDDDDDIDDDDEFYDEDELSLSETEVTQALKIAGLNDTITEEVVGMLKN